MKVLFSFLFFTSLIILATSFSSTKGIDFGKNYCNIEIVQAYTQEVLGKNVGFFVRFKNNSEKEMDAIDYQVSFMNGFGEVKGQKQFSWQSGNLSKPIKPGQTLNEGATNWIDGANKIEVKILRAHFTDGSTCKGQSDNSTRLR
jgi:hypothetical protein